MPTLPALVIERAAGEEVAYASVLVPIYRLPPMEEKSQCLRFAPAEVSERASDGRVPATWKSQFGVEVPTPTFPPYGLRRRLLVVPALPMMKLPELEEMGPPKVVVAVELKVLAPETVRALETVRLAAERAVTAPHWKTAPYMVMALLLAVRMRYFIEVPLG